MVFLVFATGFVVDYYETPPYEVYGDLLCKPADLSRPRMCCYDINQNGKCDRATEPLIATSPPSPSEKRPDSSYTIGYGIRITPEKVNCSRENIYKCTNW